MGIALTDLPIERQSIASAATAPGLVAQLDAVFLLAGWTSSAIMGGYLYTIESPQGLQAKVRLVASGAYVEVSVLSVDGLLEGPRHRLEAAAGRSYIVHAGICQFFIGLSGTDTSTPANNTACGGIPYVPNLDPLPECAETFSSSPVTDAWWSCGYIGLRAGVMCSEPHWTEYAGCYNGDLQTSDAGIFAHAHWSKPRLLTLQPAGYGSLYYGNAPQVTWRGGRPLLIEPFLAWGSGGHYDSQLTLRGQLWDAVVHTAPAGLDALVSLDALDASYDDTTWYCFSGDYDPLSSPEAGFGNHFGVLCLLHEDDRPPVPAGGLANCAY